MPRNLKNSFQQYSPNQKNLREEISDRTELMLVVKYDKRNLSQNHLSGVQIPNLSFYRTPVIFATICR